MYTQVCIYTIWIEREIKKKKKKTQLLKNMQFYQDPNKKLQPK